MADTAPVAGPSRPRPAPISLADKIIQLQRKNAAAAPPRNAPPPPPPRRRQEDDFNRGSDRNPPQRALFDPSSALKSPLPIIPKSPRLDQTAKLRPHPHDPPRDGPVGHRHLFDPSMPAPPRPKAERSPQPDAEEPRRLFRSEPTGRTLFDPHRPLPPRDRSPLPEAEDRHRLHHSEPIRRGEPSSKKLFNPDIHDPHQFQPRPGVPAPSQGPIRRNITNGMTREEEADRERERRKRREGSERGSMHSKRKDADAKSKESRSSEGSESLRDRERGKGKGDTGVKVILKDLHNRIRALEQDLMEIHRRMAADPEAGISVLRNQAVDAYSRDIRNTSDDLGSWMELIGKHKLLADLHHEFLVRVFDPLVPATYQQLAIKYNIPSRLWQTGFHPILERLRYAWMSNQAAALDLLTDLVYDAYKFYTDLLEDQSLGSFRTAWIEALGDLARYRMAIASHVVSETEPVAAPSPMGRINDDDDEPPSSAASIGADVANSWDVEDKETWRTTARDWYNMGITEKPDEGRLHHHLALLSRDVRGQETRALHHFTKSLIVTHEYETSRESILPLFDSALQSRRSLPEATAMDLFVRLHGMLFTKISLDDFPSVMSRYMERLEEDATLDGINRKATISQVDWMLMASVNIAAVMQYGASSGVARKALAQEGQERRRNQAGTTDPEDGEQEGDVEHFDPSGVPVELSEPLPAVIVEAPITATYTYALQLTFAVFGSALAHPTRMQGMHSVLNPYITTLTTFLATLLRHPPVTMALFPAIPWQALVGFINSSSMELREETRLALGPPLPEDWAVRGMEWVGRKTYERGFWKPKGSGRGSGALAQPRLGERFQSEMDVLLASFDSAVDISEGVVDEIDGTDLTDGPVAVNQRRWRRVAWAAGILIKHVDGLSLVDGKVIIDGELEAELEKLEAIKQAGADEELKRSSHRREPEIDLLDVVYSDSGEENSELAELKQRHRDLRTLVGTAAVNGKSNRQAKKPSVNAVPGYTMLVFDTNVLLNALSLFSKVVEGGRWKVVIPLPVVTELDGLAKNTSDLGISAVAAISYLESHIRSHSLNLKIQTSKGNYLSDLLIRTEHLDFRGSEVSRSMDDLILGIASFQNDHFVDKSGGDVQTGGASKVLLVTSDRNLRLKARGRGVGAVDGKELTRIIGGT